MTFTALVDLTLDSRSGPEFLPGPTTSFDFVMTFEQNSWAAAILPEGTEKLLPGKRGRAQLAFLAGDSAAIDLTQGRIFRFREAGSSGERHGTGQVLSVRYK
jgi:hypothetical protein